MADSFEIPVAKTSLLIAAERYRESHRPDRLINDPYAEILLGQAGMKMIEGMKAAFTNVVQTRAMGLRAKWVEDLLQKAVSNGITQIVNPACGLDTYAWRINLPSHIRYFELDFAEVIDYKVKLLTNTDLLCNYTPIGADLRDESWSQKLIESGFDKTKKTLWVTMGLLLYIPEDGVHKLLGTVNELSAPGSWYTADVFKFVKEDPEGAQYLVKFLKANGTPLEFSTDKPDELFAKHGFTKVLTKLSYLEYSATVGVKFSEDNSKLREQQKSGTSLMLVEK